MTKGTQNKMLASLRRSYKKGRACGWEVRRNISGEECGGRSARREFVQRLRWNEDQKPPADSTVPSI